MKNFPLMRLQTLAQWMAVCAAVLVLSGCNISEYSSSQPAPAIAPAGQTFPRTLPSVPVPVSVNDGLFQQEKKRFEDHEYAPQIWSFRDDRAFASLEPCNFVPKECYTLDTAYHLHLINASAAYARGATGKGEIVAVVDDGIDHRSNEFDALDENGQRTGSKVAITTQPQKIKVGPKGEKELVPYDPIAGDPDPQPSRSRPDTFNHWDGIRHGTAVASLIAARRDGRKGYDGLPVGLLREQNMQGVAFDAALYFHQVALGRFGFETPHNLSDWTEEHDKRIAEQYFDLSGVRESGARIVNHSFVWPNIGDIDHFDEQVVREKFKHTAAAIAQKDIPNADKIIVVRAAGNSGEKVTIKRTSPELHSGLGVHFPELRGHVLAVVAVDRNGELAKFSNPCGSAKVFCLAAPGVNLLAVDPFDGHGDAGDLVGEHDDYKEMDIFPVPKNLEFPPFEQTTYPPFPRAVEVRKFERENFHKNTVPNTRRAPTTNVVSGTSFATALVSGGLALLRQHFSVDHADGTRSYQLGSTELVARLLATANRAENYANSDKYGHGLMDLDKATAPVGALATSLSTDPTAQPFDASAFSLSGNAFGGAMRDALGGVKIAAFDELDAPFFFPLADGVSHAPQISAGHSDTLHEHEVALGDAANASLALSLAAGELSAARIRRGNLWFSYGHHGGREAGLYFGDDGGNSPENFGMNFSAENVAENPTNAARHFRAPLAFASPYLSLVRDGPGLGWSQPLRSGARFGFSLMHGAPQFDHFQNPGGARGLGALFDFRPNNASLSLQAGAVREADGFLGARAQGNFGEISADTAFAGIGGDWAAMQNWRLLASAYLGHTKADTGDGMLRAADDIVSSAFSLGLARASLARRGDWLGLRLSQPLRAESGAAHLRIPAGRTKYREVIHRAHKLELTPSGRNLQVEAEYRVPFAGGNLRAGLGFDRHANHDRARDLETFLRLGFERRF